MQYVCPHYYPEAADAQGRVYGSPRDSIEKFYGDNDFYKKSSGKWEKAPKMFFTCDSNAVMEAKHGKTCDKMCRCLGASGGDIQANTVRDGIAWGRMITCVASFIFC